MTTPSVLDLTRTTLSVLRTVRDCPSVREVARRVGVSHARVSQILCAATDWAAKESDGWYLTAYGEAVVSAADAADSLYLSRIRRFVK